METIIYVNAACLSVNGVKWKTAPKTMELCSALCSAEPLDGDDVFFNGRKDSKFRYFDSIGISIIETASNQRAKRIAVHFPNGKNSRRVRSPYGVSGERATTSTFAGILNLNGKELRFPVSTNDFPFSGELDFIHGIALGSALSSIVVIESSLVKKICFDFNLFE